MRYLITIVIAALSLNAFGQVPGHVSTDGLVAYFPFDGNFNDASGNGNHGQNNGASFGPDRFGIGGGAGSFNGVSSYVNGSLGGLNNPSETTVSLWLLSQGDAGGQPYDLFFQLGNYGQHTFAYAYNHSGANVDLYSQCFYNPYASLNINDTWHHLVIVSGAYSATLYVDGAVYVNMTSGGGGCYLGSNAFFIGGGADNQYTTGRIDEVGFWDRALTVEEVVALYNAEEPVEGCTDATACNYDSGANLDNGNCIPSGCLEPTACNYNSMAECEGEACDYTCCPGPGCCNIGMTWNWELGICETSIPTDSNLDGCTDLNDLMDLLGAYGDCAVADFTCGDDIEHQGYDYSTVQIGEQCWFSENCRYLPEVSDPSINSTTEPHYSVYGYTGTDVTEAQATANYETYGVLYNWPAVMTEGICPSGWHISTDGEWQTMEISLGMSEADASSEGWRGTDEGYQMKSTSGWNSSGNSSNSSGFNGLPGGYRYDVSFSNNGGYGFWWSASESGSNSWRRVLYDNNDNVGRLNHLREYGFSARCVRD